MKRLCKILGTVAAVLFVAAVALYFYLPRLNSFQSEGDLDLPGLKHPASILRDAKGIPYAFASCWPDAFFLQGFMCAQDRMFQMHLNRLMAGGRISELAGAKARSLDIRMRTIGLKRIAARAAARLNPDDKALLQSYANGVNAFLTATPGDLPIEFRLAGIKPEPWTVVDSLSILYYMGFVTSANMETEIRAQVLVDKLGMEKARQLLPLNINPEEGKPLPSLTPPDAGGKLGFLANPEMMAHLSPLPLTLGSNNWAISPKKAGGAQAIVAGDPHLDARMLPGVWHAFGIFMGTERMVGAMVPGIPGMALGRTRHVALSMTNSYGDVQDLYISKLDPANPGKYLDQGKSLPFVLVRETLKIKDSSQDKGFRTENITIRYTRFGPVVSGFLPKLAGGGVISLRWAPAERLSRRLGIFRIIKAKNVNELAEGMRDLPMLMLNWVFADTKGNIAYRASGTLPLRAGRTGTLPVLPGQNGEWVDWVPFNLMPHAMNPAKGWLGTCNHATVKTSTPYYYSSYFAPTFRYARLMELMAAPGPKGVDFCWNTQRDTLNRLARRVAPIMAGALAANQATAPLAGVLAGWDFRDDPEKAAPTVFQMVFIRFAREVLKDELGPEALKVVLSNWYFWQQRLTQMIEQGKSEFFDDVTTKDKTETMADLFQRAGRAVLQEFSPKLGADPAQWKWGRIHTMEFVNPIRRQGFGAAWLGSGKLPMGGSGETLYRGWYELKNPAAVTNSASLRMVVDLSDPDKVTAVLAAGNVARTFHPGQKNQIEAFMTGKKLYWWFGPSKVKEMSVSELRVYPVR